MVLERKIKTEKSFQFHIISYPGGKYLLPYWENMKSSRGADNDFMYLYREWSTELLYISLHAPRTIFYNTVCVYRMCTVYSWFMLCYDSTV